MAERRKSPKKVVENRKKEVSWKLEIAIFKSRKTGKSLKYLRKPENTFEKLRKPEKSL